MHIKQQSGIVLALWLAATTGWTEMNQLHVVVTSTNVPGGASLYLTGNDELLGNWSPGGYALSPAGEGRWEAFLRFDAGRAIEFKVTRGTWESEALDEQGVVPANHTVTIEGETTMTIDVPSWKDSGNPVEGGITGEVRYHQAVEGQGAPPRDIIVWLPPGYEDGQAHYPVLYMHDGQNVFDPRTSFTGIDWGVDEAADKLIREGSIRPCIVVGMYNTPIRRDEYGADETMTHAYMEFVVKTVKPMIDAEYRTLVGRDDTFVMGSSMGGCISWLLAWNYPQVFSGAGCLSPAFMFGNIFNDVASFSGPPKNLRIYLDNGGVGMDRDRMQPALDELLAILPAQAPAIGLDYTWHQFANAEHNEAAWRDRIDLPLTYLLGTGP